MEFDRRVQLRVQRPDGTRGFGSGYLVAPRLVLTAAHVLPSPGAGPGAVSVTRPDAGERRYPATVRWYRRDERVDAALVEVDDGHGWQVPGSLADVRTRPPQRWGRLIGTREHPVTVAGFPRMQKDPDDGRRLDEQLTGHLSPGTGALAGRYEVSGLGPTVPASRGAQGTRWSGMSGAALLAEDPHGDDLLCGVVRGDRQAEGGTRLTATPLYALFADDAFRALLTEHGEWEPILEPAEPVGLLAPAARERDLRSPAMLLRADVEAVTFHSRETEVRRLLDWCRQGRDTLALQVLTGPGGQGKTRLARHLTDALRREGWITGHLRADLRDDAAAPADWTTLATAHPLLLVADYAETRPHLVRHLIERLRTTRHRVRLLLLARSDGEWRTDALGSTAPTRELLRTAPLFELGPLLPPGPRTAAFADATADLARLLERFPAITPRPTASWPALASTLQPPADLDDPRHDSALTLQMTALAALLQHGPAPVTTAPGEPAEATLLSHEQRYWEDSAGTPAFRLGDLSTSTLRRAVAVAVLCGAADRGEAEAAVRKTPGLPPEKALATAEWLQALYPPGPDRYWGSLQPDRVAEYHASTALTGADTLTALLTDASADQQAQTLTVLARSVTAHYNARRTAVSERVLRELEAGVEAASLHAAALESTAAALPGAHVVRPLALRLTTQLVDALRQLAAEDPAGHESPLAMSLHNLGFHLSEARRHREGIAATEEALGIWRRLAEADPGEYESDVAQSLHNLGGQLAEAGQSAQGLAAERQALEIRRRLAAADPAAHAPGLAASLHNLGGQLAATGRRGEALAAAREALEIWRRLAESDPAVHEPDVALGLYNLAKYLSEAGNDIDALRAAEESLEIRHRLAARNLAAHEPDLATSLRVIGILRSVTGPPDEALAAAEEAWRIRSRLAARRPDVHQPDLADALHTLGRCLEAVGRNSEALDALGEAARINRELAAADPVHERGLAETLHDLGACLSSAGQHAEALEFKQQAVAIRHRLTRSDPATHGPALAASLYNLGLSLANLGAPEKAVEADAKALEIRRALADADPAAHLPDLAASLFTYGTHLFGADRYAEALAATEEAVRTYRELAAADPAAHALSLAASLYALALQLELADRPSRALNCTGEAVELYRQHLNSAPAHHRWQLRDVLDLQANLLDALDRGQDASHVRDWLAANAGYFDASE